MNASDLQKLAQAMHEVREAINKMPTDKAPPQEMIEAADAIREEAHRLSAAANRFLEG